MFQKIIIAVGIICCLSSVPVQASAAGQDKSVLQAIKDQQKQTDKNDGTSDKKKTEKTDKSDREEPGAAQSEKDKPAGGMSLYTAFLKLIAALAVVLLLIYLLYRFVGKKTRRFQHADALKHMGGLSLGPNRSVQLVKIGDRLLVVGVGDDITLLKEVDEEEALLLGGGDENQAEHLSDGVSRIVKWADGLLSKRKDSRITADEHSFKKTFEEKLRTMNEEHTGRIRRQLDKENKDG